jgi:D-sedoheptulose 7-phosphate isomerase
VQVPIDNRSIDEATFVDDFLVELSGIAHRLDRDEIDAIATRLEQLRAENGRVFVIGVGGGAANATHAVCDLRGLAGIEAYSATDNAATLTATANDYGWRQSVSRWLTGSHIGPRDLLMVFSVGGGSETPPVSVNLVEAVKVALAGGATVCGVVGPDGGETARLAHLCIRVPVLGRSFWTTHTEIYQSVVWHLLVTHPRVRATTPKWESLNMSVQAQN